jgi:predicted small secreted protein
MKKAITFTLAALLLTLVVSACGSSKGAGCDAYGKTDSAQSTDLAAK